MTINGVSGLNFQGYKGKIKLPDLPYIPKPHRQMKIAMPTTDCFLRADKVITDQHFDKSFSFRDVICLTKEASEPKKKLDAVLGKYLSKYVASDNNPDLPIREIKGRIKNPKSLMEKIQALIQNVPELLPKMETKAGIKENINDIIGKEIILRNDDKNETIKIIEELFSAHKNGDLNIYEVEVYYPSLKGREKEFVQFMKEQYGKKITQKECDKIIADKEYFSYIYSKELNKLANEYGIKINYPPRNNGYTAIHIGTLLPDGYKGEVKIIGCNVKKLSDVQHPYYKAMCGKEVEPVLKDKFNPIMPQYSDTKIKKLTQEYTFFAFIFERLKAKIPYKQKINTEFLVAPKPLLDLGLGFNQTAPLIRKAARTKQQ